MPNRRKRRKAATAEGRMNTLIDLAVDVTEEQLREGNIHSSTQNQLLKLATERERLERTKLEREIVLLNEKAEQIKSAERIESLFEDAISAMREYGGHGDEDDPNIH